jgi:chromosome partitioning protein
MIIAMLNQKGGSGKTTLSTHLAGELAKRERQVSLIDADPQGSALDWAQRRAQLGLPRRFGVMGLARETLHQEVPQIAQSHHHVIIDGPARVTALARSAILAADLVLIPVQPSPYDVWASAEIVALVTEAKIFKPQLQAAFVISRRIVGTLIGREMRETLADFPIHTLNAAVSQRVIFAECASHGQLVDEADITSLGAREIAALGTEVLGYAP